MRMGGPLPAEGKPSRRGNRRVAREASSGGLNASRPRATASAEEPAAPQSAGARPARTELTSLEAATAAVPPNAKTAVGAALVAASAGLGVALGGYAPLRARTTARATIGALTGAAGAYGASRAEATRKRAAAKSLCNSFADGSLSPDAVTPEDIASWEAQNNVRSVALACPEELSAVYDSYLTNVLSTSGDDGLEGWEADALRRFKDALGLDDSDAAQIHTELGRRIFRRRMEEDDKSGEVSARKEFQLLIFISTLVFGEAKSRFLLPWKRLFNITEGEMNVAVRDGASALFRRALENRPQALSGESIEQLRELRQFQRQVLLSDESASEIFTTAVKESASNAIVRAADKFKANARSGDMEQPITHLREILVLNGRLRDATKQAVANEDDKSDLPPGLGPVTMVGTQMEKERMKDMRDLFRMYFAEHVKDGLYSEELESELKELQSAFGIGNKEAESVKDDVLRRVFRNRIRKALSEGELEKADSPANFLEATCTQLRFPPESAAEINKELFLVKLNKAMEDNMLSEEEEEELQKMRRVLCLNEDMVKEARRESCGKVYREAVERAISAGTDGFNPTLRKEVHQTQQNVRLENDIALGIVQEVAQKAFLSFVREARSKPSKVENAKELRKMTFFNSSVITPIVHDITGSVQAKSSEQEEIDKIMKEAKEEAAKEEAQAEDNSEQREFKKEGEVDEKEGKQEEAAGVQKQKEQSEGATQKWQNQVHLREQLSERDRSELYKNYLIFCMTGDQIDAPLGQVITVERDQAEFTRLQEVGDIIGMNQIEIMQVQKDLAEEAFKANAEQVLADGNLTDERKEKLDSLQKQLNLSDDSAQSIIKGITNRRIASEMQQRSGSMSLKDMLDMKEQGIDITAVASQHQRLKLLRQGVEEALSDGTGQFNPAHYGENLPNELGLQPESALKAVREAGEQKRRTTLVQAVSAFRQKNNGEAMKSLNNLASCQLASGAEALQWNNTQELEDLYCFYASRAHEGAGFEQAEKALLSAIGLNSERASQLRAQVDRGELTLEQEDTSDAMAEESLY